MRKDLIISGREEWREKYFQLNKEDKIKEISE